ncbi:MAG TPA: hypothetical protein V6D16_17685, partial [Candidatus Obscuribacterales bacterium]
LLTAQVGVFFQPTTGSMSGALLSGAMGAVLGTILGAMTGAIIGTVFIPWVAAAIAVGAVMLVSAVLWMLRSTYE